MQKDLHKYCYKSSN